MENAASATDDAPEATPSRVEFVVSSLGERIVGNVYQPGATLPTEQEIGHELGVGRNAVREAIKVLAGKGFVRTERRAGSIVQPRNHWSMLDPTVLGWIIGNPSIRDGLLADLTALRRMVEPEVVALAAQHATITETLRIFEAYERMERHQNDAELAIAADVEFHERLFEAAHNPLLASLSRAFGVLLQANFTVSIGREGGFIRNLKAHRLIAEAIHQRNPEAARTEMLKLLANNDEDLRAVLGRRPTRRITRP
jgi:DNA-binding FadR family transcriptional regulator